MISISNHILFVMVDQYLYSNPNSDRNMKTNIISVISDPFSSIRAMHKTTIYGCPVDKILFSFLFGPCALPGYCCSCCYCRAVSQQRRPWPCSTELYYVSFINYQECVRLAYMHRLMDGRKSLRSRTKHGKKQHSSLVCSMQMAE